MLFISILIMISFLTIEAKVKIQASKDPTIVKQILKNHGLYEPSSSWLPFGHNGNGIAYVSKSVDGKSNCTYGDIICRMAMKVLGTQGIIAVNRVKTHDVIITDDIQVENQVIVQNTLASAVACKYELIFETYVFYLANAPKENYYYVFNEIKEENSSGPSSTVRVTVDEVIKLFITPENYLKVVSIHETNDSVIADDIFGIYGHVSRKSKKHICNQQKVSKEVYCDLAKKLLVEKNDDNELLEQSPTTSCIHIRVVRQMINVETRRQVETKKILMVKCQFISSFFTIIGGPNEYYYIGESIYKQSRNNYSKVKIAAVTKLQLPIELQLLI